jgi:hypothetical protein
MGKSASHQRDAENVNVSVNSRPYNGVTTNTPPCGGELTTTLRLADDENPVFALRQESVNVKVDPGESELAGRTSDIALKPLPTTTFCDGVKAMEVRFKDESLTDHDAYPPVVVNAWPDKFSWRSAMTLPTIVDELTDTNGRSLLKTETVIEVVDVRPALVTYTVTTDVVNEDAATMTRVGAVFPEGRLKPHEVEMTGSD